jgi:hypothetical protein
LEKKNATCEGICEFGKFDSQRLTLLAPASIKLDDYRKLVRNFDEVAKIRFVALGSFSRSAGAPWVAPPDDAAALGVGSGLRSEERSTAPARLARDMKSAITNL